ncbi:DNA replication initiation control protein YabA [Halalkalibacter akibai]|uniref:Replication initiation control protein YabA n=1 Tax=Halalkalibacter akibai (strain ATCC 43226 / DSM 21942 / CIP 109018 / JCM 9157 / 1139) TaxID=1236973 RepID=W4QY25_HALA3|nr:DNA replication initiation control protein YabA [Halalkalibacter akibai]GAE36548.1 DNA replication intiation control protein YabA [Halalkalibacter akibai JCM 9157]
MDKKAIFTQVSQLEERLGELHHELRGLKEQLAYLIEENHYLHIENENLRERLEAQEEIQEVGDKKTVNVKKSFVGEGYDNLARLYQEGFHICNTHYGSIRSDGDDCLFCLSFLHQK